MSSNLLDRSTNAFNVNGLSPGKEHFVSVTARNDSHGFGKRSIASPKSIIPVTQAPSETLDASLSVNPGHSDSSLIAFDSTSGDDSDTILRCRVELNSLPLFNFPIIEHIDCPRSNKKTFGVLNLIRKGSSFGVISLILKDLLSMLEKQGQHTQCNLLRSA